MKHYRRKDTMKPVSEQEVRDWFASEKGVTPPSIMGPSYVTGSPFVACKAASSMQYDRRLEKYGESWRTDAGGWQQQVIDIVDLPIEQAKANMHAWLEEVATKAGAVLKNGYPQWEIDGWHKQEAQARAALEGSTDTPLLDALAETRGVDRLWLAQKIVDKVATYETAYGMLGGKRQAIEAAIEDAETVADLRLITW